MPARWTQAAALRQAEARFPVRYRMTVPPRGFGRRLDALHAWLGERLGRDGYALHPAPLLGADAVHLYLPDIATLTDFRTWWGTLDIIQN